MHHFSWAAKHALQPACIFAGLLLIASVIYFFRTSDSYALVGLLLSPLLIGIIGVAVWLVCCLVLWAVGNYNWLVWCLNILLGGFALLFVISTLFANMTNSGVL